MELSNDSITPSPLALKLVKPLAVYLLSVVEPSANVTFWSQVFAADAKPPALVVSFISEDKHLIPYCVSFK